MTSYLGKIIGKNLASTDMAKESSFESSIRAQCKQRIMIMSRISDRRLAVYKCLRRFFLR